MDPVATGGAVARLLIRVLLTGLFWLFSTGWQAIIIYIVSQAVINIEIL